MNVNGLLMLAVFAAVFAIVMISLGVLALYEIREDIRRQQVDGAGETSSESRAGRLFLKHWALVLVCSVIVSLLVLLLR